MLKYVTVGTKRFVLKLNYVTVGTKMLPRDLQFFNSPDSSCLSSFPNTPCDSVDESQSSTASLVDEVTPVSCQTTNTDKQLLNAKRRLPSSRRSKMANPTKVRVHLIIY